MKLEPAEGFDCVYPGDPRARAWGFTPERWEGSYLAKEEGRVLLSLLQASSPGKGYLRDLVAGIEAEGLRVAVPTPLGRMVEILRRWGFVPHTEHDELFGPVEVWERARPGLLGLP